MRGQDSALLGSSRSPYRPQRLSYSLPSPGAAFNTVVSADSITINVASLLINSIAEKVAYWGDIAFAVGTFVVGILGFIAVTDSEGIFNYTDRAILKIGA